MPSTAFIPVSYCFLLYLQIGYSFMHAAYLRRHNRIDPRVNDISYLHINDVNPKLPDETNRAINMTEISIDYA